MLGKLNKLSIKLCILSSTLILAVIGTTARFTLAEARAAIVTEVKIKTESLARITREAFSPKLDIFTLHLHVNGMAGERAVKYAFICDTSGKILSHSVPQKIGEIYSYSEALASNDVMVRVAREKDGLEYHYFSAPVMFGGKRVATAVAAINSDTVNGALKETRKKIILISLIALMAAISGTVLIVNWLMRPLPLLLNAAKAIGEGKLETRVKWKSGDEIGLLTSAFNDMAQGLKERNYIRDVFGRYVSKEIANTILTGELTLGGERKNIAVLFADIRDFAKLSGKLGPEQIVQLLNNYFSAMTRIVQSRGGTIDKFIGDGILAIFGAPMPLKNPTLGAVMAAIEMQAAVKTMNEKSLEKHKEAIRVGVSVASGPAVVGTIGSQERAEYTAVGEPVNLASRLEGLNKRFGTSIIISKSAHEETAGKIKVNPLGTQKIRGWDDPMEVFEVLGTDSAEVF